LATLWYSGDVDRFFTPASHFQHERNPFPLVAGGRMFIVAHEVIHAIDIYTGRYLWRAEMPLTPWVAGRYMDSRYYGRPTERNCVAAADRVYAVAGDDIVVFDAATGERVASFAASPELRARTGAAPEKTESIRYMGVEKTIQAAPLWTEVRLWDDLLVARLGKALVALDRHTGATRWTRPSSRATTTFAIGGAVLFGLDCAAPVMGGTKGAKNTTGLLFAATPATGAVR